MFLKIFHSYVPSAAWGSLLPPVLQFFCIELMTIMQYYYRTMDYAFDSKSLYFSLFLNSFMPIVLTDKEDNIIDVNKKFCSLLGYTREEMLSMSLADIVPAEKSTAGTSIITHDLKTREGKP
ncbi:MAG: hypothetical protein DRP59_08780, partial [Spirochaetes bacterium]